MTSAQLYALALATLVAGAPLTLAAGWVGRGLAAVTACAASVGALVLGLVALSGAGGAYALPVFVKSGGTLGHVGPSGALDLPALVIGRGIATVVALTVLAVVLAVQVFAAWYLEDDDRYPVFAATVGLFAGAMLLLVISRDLILTLIGWEVMGWCSYLLIGHWSRKASARRAAYKAFLVTRFADIALVTGIAALIASTGTSEIGAVIDRANAGWLLTFAMCALVIGVMGKAAQLPFQDWLIDAMEGPTPASALIHAATMVAAGTWVLSQLAPLLIRAPAAQWLLAVVVAATMTYAAFTAFFQSDLKRLLAWSTVSQIAVMLAPLAAGPDGQDAAGAATGHLVSHAIFKALLFLTVGWLAVLGGSTAARALTGTGALRPLAQAAWGMGLLSLAGVPLTVGGFSKEHVIAVAAWVEGGSGPGARQALVSAALLATVAMTAAYATRAYEVVAAPRRLDAHPAAPREASALAQLVLGVLAAATIGASLLFVTGVLPGASLHLGLLVLSIGLILVGVLVGWYLRPDDAKPPTRLMAMADKGFGADTAYVTLVAKPVLALARAVAFVDREIVDLYVRGAGSGTPVLAALAGRAHRRERVATNLVWVLLGLLAVAGVALWA
ncbi:MAG: NADH-quinone oxidoreductase subunit L [Dermatophilaceae bacterium]